ncbi:ComEC/Rec2 family competence protein [Psychrobacter sp. APC 3426]|uniref:ComEC/Rec2 family competence protein n=1 Tax=Psychrobacter sp. APC 3426 TaxID=3035177 RepID=UPI0025B2CF52|nr:ComEC/Rec2 family competence protein [Psychrobacter sp. APC 3426]MDN3399656.1 ComEC/Rec2 family competence protein [Psychrobacter sp. APC 3426]
MYWLIGSLIIIAMMGVLAVAGSMPIPTDLLSINSSSAPILPLVLILLSFILMAVASYNIPAVTDSHPSNNLSHRPNHKHKRFFHLFRYVLVVILAIGLIVASALQALVSHQQAESTEITESMRVQALVTIEGISDSVYDVASNSGYRQVATISRISPLVSELSAQELNKQAAKYVADNKNSLSKNNPYDDINKANGIGSKHRILLSAYPKRTTKKQLSSSNLTSLNDLQPGDQLWMSLTLAPLATSEQAVNNPSGFDSYRWLRGRHIDGVATILATSESTVFNVASPTSTSSSHSYLKRFRTRIDQGRWQLRQHFHQDWGTQSIAEQQAKAVTLSLLTGDRSLINRDTKDLYQLAGISHLLAISGTHVLFLAIMLAGTVILLFNRFYTAAYRHMPRWQIRWWVMIGAAFIYALFTGFDVPAARTAWMLLAVGLVRLTLLPVSTMRVLLALAVLMAWHDPYVLWQAGYWLSFIAVALLLKYDDGSYKHHESAASEPILVSKSLGLAHSTQTKNVVWTQAWIIAKRVFKLQFWLFITLLPITLLLFGKASLWGLIVNLFAIGLFGWVIVPLNLLAGLCYLFSPTVADAIWALVSAIVAALHKLIHWLTSLPVLSEAWLYTPINMAIVLMMLLSILPWLLPRGFISRWLTLPPLTLLMMTVYANQQSLTTIPTLYILPTGDQYISASLLKYPITNNDGASEDSVSWLFLADHRPKGSRTMATSLTVNVLSATLEQQLGSLSVDNVEGIIVQSSSAVLSDTLNKNNKQNMFQANASELLPMTVLQLNQHLPIGQYWQAGRSDRWSTLQKSYQTVSKSNNVSTISAQRCEQGKKWQLDAHLSIQAMTGWSKINDASIWDCSVAIDTESPIKIVKYNAAAPLKSSAATVQSLTAGSHHIQPLGHKTLGNQAPDTETLKIKAPEFQAKNAKKQSYQSETSHSRIILSADTHQRVWQMWSLLCSDDSIGFIHSTWLGHSASHTTADIISQQRVNDIVTHDDKPLEVAFTID